MTVESVFTNIHGREAEVFFVLLLTSGKYSFLPELYEIFGKDSTIKFLELFAGMTVEVPSVKRLSSLARDTKVYTRVKNANPSHRATVIKSLAREFSTDEKRIRLIYDRTRTFLEGSLGFKLVKRRGHGKA